ncbi:MAG TPA: hypothetical protein VM686_09395 [Polyangiaceae bacterium]|nr:hypothetical protein [Polyangiaceae bacterium]
MANKFVQFLQDNKIDPRRLIVASFQLEKLGPEDRKAKLAKRQAKGGKAPAAAEGEAKEPVKRRSGRPVTPRLMASVTAGKPVTGPAKTRVLRALNRVLEQKKKKPVDLKTIF